MPSQTNFVLVGFPSQGARTARAAEDFLAGRGILVRGLANYRLPNHLRITVGLEEHNRALADALAAFIGGLYGRRRDFTASERADGLIQPAGFAGNKGKNRGFRQTAASAAASPAQNFCKFNVLTENRRWQAGQRVNSSEQRLSSVGSREPRGPDFSPQKAHGPVTQGHSRRNVRSSFPSFQPGVSRLWQGAIQSDAE